jgi:DNA-binding winged helix-turn-helix (wHTH) protein
MRLRFGDCSFDSRARELRRGGGRVALTPKAFQLLELLLRRRPEAVSRAEIQDALWPTTYVSVSSLARVATDLRQALCDDARDPRYVRTLHGFGYVFSGEVVDETAPASGDGDPLACRLVWGVKEIPLGEGLHVVGRAPDAAVFIDSTRVSRHHARIVVAGGRAMLEDLGSKNGTFLRGQRLSARAELADGDLIGVGPVLLKFRSPRALSSTESDIAG